MDFPLPDCHDAQLPPCAEADWVLCTECSQLTCTVHAEVAPVRWAGKYAANIDRLCTRCALALNERGEVSAIRNGYQYIYRR